MPRRRIMDLLHRRENQKALGRYSTGATALAKKMKSKGWKVHSIDSSQGRRGLNELIRTRPIPLKRGGWSMALLATVLNERPDKVYLQYRAVPGHQSSGGINLGKRIPSVREAEAMIEGELG